MCTCISLKTKDNYFGRNLDLEYSFNQNIVITPRNYEVNLKKEGSLKTRYAMIGMATAVDGYPLYAEASNEKGLSIAGLNFPYNAYYGRDEKDKINITPYELSLWILGNFASVEELKNVINQINIVDIPFNKEIPVTPLHWMISDDKECIVIEQTIDGFKYYSNTIGVLTNNPPFEYHLNNINNYINISPKNKENTFSDKVDLKHYGEGMGAIGLPGDNSSVSRFIRAAFNKLNSKCEEDEISSVTQFFHILDSVAMVKGSVITKNNKCEVTTYSCCINQTKGIYYYKTYHNNQITAVQMNEENMNKKELTSYELIQKQQINYIN